MRQVLIQYDIYSIKRVIYGRNYILPVNYGSIELRAVGLKFCVGRARICLQRRRRVSEMEDTQLYDVGIVIREREAAAIYIRRNG